MLPTHWGIQRFLTLVTASALAAAAAVVGIAAPATAAVTAPTGLQNADQPCVTAAPGPYLSPGRLNDARAVVLKGTFDRTGAGTNLQADFQVWDITDPENRQQWLRIVGNQANEVYVQLEDESRQLDGVTYAWRVRVLDGAEAGPWSVTCYFTVDRSGGPAPGVASTEYAPGWWDNPGGAIGVPGVFRLTSASEDTVSYRYRMDASELEGSNEYSDVAADGLGGSASIRWTPQVAGLHSLVVYAIDRAGNWSERAVHDFVVRETRPSIFSAAYPDWGRNLDYNVGVPGAFELRSSVPDTASFGWRIDGGGPSGTVPADADGKATAMIAPTRAGQQTLYVHSITSGGTAHPARAYKFFVDNGPLLTGDTDREVVIGSSYTFQLAPRVPEVEAYLYWVQYRWPEERPIEKVTVAARPDGTATATWTATAGGVEALYFQSRSANGTLSEPRLYAFSVDMAAPRVTRTGGTDVATSATFTARTRMENPVDYLVALNGDPATEKIVKANADGSATFQFTPAKGGYHYVSVVARNAAGIATESGGTSWTVLDGPRVTSTDFPMNGSGRLAEGTFTFAPRLAGTTGYEYSFNHGPYLRIEAGPTGTATLTWTPGEEGQQLLAVRSVTAAGTRSAITWHGFGVEAAVATIASVSPATVPAGGVSTITISGTGLHRRDVLRLTPAGGAALTANVKTVSTDGETMTAEVNLASAATGPATLTLHPYGARDPLVRAGAVTITAAPALRSVKKPTIGGTVAVGGTAKASPGEWAPTATAYTYQWLANGSAIKGATKATYQVPASLLGKRLTVTVTASRAGHTATKATSAATEAVAKGKAPKATKKPKIVGTAKVGRTVKADVGTWSPKVDSYRYEWRLNGKLIKGATARTLKLKSSMRNKKITVTVIARKTGYADGRATSTAVTVRR
ncbi:hypothetical protein [Micromonospora endophytica]|uniref:hypothetical protein n=1 Tax=Micromonospora endophytica TaxID=515350 RepID=UPI0015E8846E|nr:hypothetical protein [Micromonospora endophytica]